MSLRAEAAPRSRKRTRTVAIVSTHCSLRNWAEKRLYEPLAETWNVELIFWNRGGLKSAEGEREARELGLGLHEFPLREWGLQSLLGVYYPFIFRELDRIHREDRLDSVICCDTDVILPVVWHRLVRGLKYRIIRHEADYYSGSRFRGRTVLHAIARGAIDAFEAVMHLCCDRILTLNRHAAERIRRWGVPGRKLLIGGLWKKDEFYSGDREASKRALLEQGLLTPAQYELLKGKVVASFFGFFYQFTHIRELLDVVAEFPDDVVLLTAGRGTDLPYVQEYARQHPNILFLGWLDETRMEEYYKAIDIVYQPLNPDENINWRYFGSTNKLCESLASGSLFIGSAINERVDLNEKLPFAELIDFRKDLREQLRILFRRIVADPAWLRERQANARRLFATYNHETFKRLWLPLFPAGWNAESAPMRIAVLYVMFEEYDLLDQELEWLARQSDLDFTFVCVCGHKSDEARIRARLEAAPFPFEIVKRTEDNGPAGGFWDGQRHCLARGYDAIVHVESDCFPTDGRLMAALRAGLEKSAVVVPLCIPERLAMGWRFCAVRAEVLRRVGLSYKALYFMTEDVYFIRNVARAFPPLVLEDVHVYHAPVVEKHTHADVYMCPYPHLISRNHMLFGLMLIRRHWNWRDVVNQLGYTVCLMIYAHHLYARGKKHSAALVLRGLWDGLLNREDVLVKERMEKTDPDYPVRLVESFDPDVVLDKETTVSLGDVAHAFSSANRRVLIKRSSQFLTFVTFFIAHSVALTDGRKTWLLKDRPLEHTADRLLFPLTVIGSVLLSVPMLVFGLLVRLAPPATDAAPPAPRGTVAAPASGARA